MTIRQAIQWGWQELSATSPSSKLDAEVLLRYLLKKDAAFLLAHDEEPLRFWQKWVYQFFIFQRKKGVPAAYLTGVKEFYGLEFEVSRHTLIPRPDTEVLVEEAVKYIKKLAEEHPHKKPLLLDIGTGSGCIPVAVLSQLPQMTAVAVDISPLALGVAKRNAKRHGVEGRVRFLHSDLLRGINFAELAGHEVIVTANLPYIPRDFSVDPSTRFEPSLALYGGGDGLEYYKKLAPQLERLKPKALFFELFEFQAATLELHFKNYRLLHKGDMTGLARVMVFERV